MSEKPPKRNIGPGSMPQQLFLTLKTSGVFRDEDGKILEANPDGDEVDIIFYGGSAAGGKTFAGLMHHLKYIHDPFYRGLTLRRTTPMLLKPGAVWDEAKSLFRDVDPKVQIKLQRLICIFKSQAEVQFTHFEKTSDDVNFQGAQISSAVMEELTQFEESQFNYIMSRLRTKAKMRANIRGTLNPSSDPDHWCRKYVEWYLYPKDHEQHGIPDPSKQGIVRWLVRDDNEIIWGDSKEELLERYPKSTPLSYAFIAASVYDNKFVDPQYVSFLEGLPRVQKEILLHGSWDARMDEDGFMKREWFIECDEEPHPNEIQSTCRSYDFAGSKASEAYPDPDFTSCVKMSRLKNGDFFIHEIRRTRIRHSEWIDFIVRCSQDDRPGTLTVLPIDPNPAAKYASSMMAKELSTLGLSVKRVDTKGKKLDRARPFISMLGNGGIRILKNCGFDEDADINHELNFFYKECEFFDGERRKGPNGHDDMVDACADGFYILAQKKVLPKMANTLSSQNFAVSNPFDN